MPFIGAERAHHAQARSGLACPKSQFALILILNSEEPPDALSS
jgi:hypothetical protein